MWVEPTLSLILAATPLRWVVKRSRQSLRHDLLCLHLVRDVPFIVHTALQVPRTRVMTRAARYEGYEYDAAEDVELCGAQIRRSRRIDTIEKERTGLIDVAMYKGEQPPRPEWRSSC